MLGPHTPGTLVVLAAVVLLTLVSISTPILKDFYFLSADVHASVASVTVKGNIKLGVFGYCIVLGGQNACSPITLGYSLDPNHLLNLPEQTSLGIPTSVLEKATYILILHPIAAGLALLAVVSGAFSHIREFSRTCWTSFFASLATFVALIAFVFDIIAFSIAKSKIANASTDSVDTNARLGINVWLTLAGFISLSSSSCFFCIGRRLIRKRYRSQRDADRLRPIADQAFADQMRHDAAKAEEAREQKMRPIMPSASTRLPAFAEYGNEDVRHEEIPLNRLDIEEEHYSDHHALLAPGPPPIARQPSSSPSDSITGVGFGYGRRTHQPTDDQSNSHPSLYSHSSFSQHHPSQRRRVYQTPYDQPQLPSMPASYFPPQPALDQRTVADASRQNSDQSNYYQSPSTRHAPPRPVYHQATMPDPNMWNGTPPEPHIDDRYYQPPPLRAPELHDMHARSIDYVQPQADNLRGPLVLPLPGESRAPSMPQPASHQTGFANPNEQSHWRNEHLVPEQGQYYVEEPGRLTAEEYRPAGVSRMPSNASQDPQSSVYSSHTNSLPVDHSDTITGQTVQRNYEEDPYGGTTAPRRRLPDVPQQSHFVTPQLSMEYKPPDPTATPPPKYH